MGWLNDCLKSVEPNTVLDWERWLLKGDTEKYFKLFANDFPNQKDDPLVYPGKISKEEAGKLPGVVLVTSEFSYSRRDTEDLIPKLKEAGVYLDHIDFSGVHYTFFFMMDEPKSQSYFDQMDMAIKMYVVDRACENEKVHDEERDIGGLFVHEY